MLNFNRTGRWQQEIDTCCVIFYTLYMFEISQYKRIEQKIKMSVGILLNKLMQTKQFSTSVVT